MTSSCREVLKALIVGGLVLAGLTLFDQLARGSAALGGERLRGDVLLTFDLSGSMEDVLYEYRSHLRFFLRSSAYGASRLGLRTFGGGGTHLVVPVSSLGHYHIDRWLSGVQRAGGGTPMGMALTAASSDFPAPRRRERTLVLISDGFPTDGEDYACEAARGLADRGVSIRYVLVGEPFQDIAFLERLVRECGTGELLVLSPEELAEFLGGSLGSLLSYGVLVLCILLVLYATYFQARFLSFLLPRYLSGRWLQGVPTFCLVLWFVSSLLLFVLVFAGLRIPWIGTLAGVALTGVAIAVVWMAVRRSVRGRVS